MYTLVIAYEDIAGISTPISPLTRCSDEAGETKPATPSTESEETWTKRRSYSLQDEQQGFLCTAILRASTGILMYRAAAG